MSLIYSLSSDSSWLCVSSFQNILLMSLMTVFTYGSSLRTSAGNDSSSRFFIEAQNPLNQLLILILSSQKSSREVLVSEIYSRERSFPRINYLSLSQRVIELASLSSSVRSLLYILYIYRKSYWRRPAVVWIELALSSMLFSSRLNFVCRLSMFFYCRSVFLRWAFRFVLLFYIESQMRFETFRMEDSSLEKESWWSCYIWSECCSERLNLRSSQSSLDLVSDMTTIRSSILRSRDSQRPMTYFIFQFETSRSWHFLSSRFTVSSTFFIMGVMTSSTFNLRSVCFPNSLSQLIVQMQRIINTVKPSKSKPQHFTDPSDNAKSFYSQQERSVQQKRKQRSKALGQTDEDNPNAQAKIQYRHSKFGHAQKKEEKEFKVIERPHVVLASQSQSKTLQTLDRRHNAIMKHPYIHLMFSPSKRVSVFKKHLTMMFRGLTYSIKYLKGPSQKFIKSKEVLLNKPENSKGRALMLDLDETLIHSCGSRQKAQFMIKAGAQIQGIKINVRPYCIQFLQQMSELFDLHIFTASTPNYAEPIIQFLNSSCSRPTIHSILTRANCMETKNGFFIKDLRIISNYHMKDVILVDNLVHSFGLQIENGIPIVEYHDDRKDEQLLYLQNYLTSLCKSEDMQGFNREHLRLAEMISVPFQNLVADL